MRVIRIVALAGSFVICSLLAFSPALAQVDIAISVDVEPPPLPVYDQPPIPEPGYLWVPGYWAWDDDTGYYWVPGTWVLPPEPALLWTPGYWGWNDGVYVFHEGYWGPQIGFYGGVAYGFSYDGVGYEGGYWRDGAFFYNRSVNNISNVLITNVYNKTVVVNNVTNVSYNGGTGGTTAQPTAQQIAAANEHHVAATAAQTQNVQAAAKDPALSLNHNQGHPTVAATTHAAQFGGAGVIAAHPGKPVAAIAPQGHTIRAATTPGNAATAPGGKVGPAAATPGTKTTAPGNAATTPSGNPPSGAVVPPGSKVGPGNAATGPSNAAIGPGNNPVPEIKEHKKGSAGTGATPGAAQPSTPLSMSTQVAPPVARRLEPGLARRARRCRAMRFTRRRRRSRGRRLRRHRTRQYHRRRLHRTRPHHRLHRRTWPPHRRHRSASLPLRRRHDRSRRRAPRRLLPKSALRINPSAERGACYIVKDANGPAVAYPF